MKTKTLLIALVLLFGVFTACTDKKKAKESTETEITAKETKTSAEDSVDKEEKRKLDSIQQVKEHGHAH